MSYGYQPRFSTRAMTGFLALEPWLQEEVLDEIEHVLNSVPVPDVAQRLDPNETVHTFSRTADGAEHVVFLLTVLEVASRQLKILRVGRSVRR